MWYKSKKRLDTVPTRDKKNRQSDKRDNKGNEKRQEKEKKIETANKTPSVLFIERTQNGGLAQKLRQRETDINKKIVERPTSNYTNKIQPLG